MQAWSIWQLNSFDFVLILILAISTAAAFRRGIVRTVFGIGGVLAGILVAAWNYNAVAEVLEQWISTRATAQAIGFLVLVAAVMAGMGVVGNMLQRTVKSIGLGLVDELLGAAFGFVRGALACLALLIGITAFLPDTDWVAQSKLTPYFLAGAHAVSFVVPTDLKERIANGAWRLKHESQGSSSSL